MRKREGRERREEKGGEETKKGVPLKVMETRADHCLSMLLGFETNFPYTLGKDWGGVSQFKGVSY